MNDKITITPIPRPAPQAIVPSRPRIPEGQERVQRQDANPRQPGGMTGGRLDTKGGQLVTRYRTMGGTWSDYAPHPGDEIEFKIVDRAPPQRRPYMPGT